MAEDIHTIVGDDLIEDCWLEVFSYLSLNDMLQVYNVCERWRQVSQQWFQQLHAIRFNRYNFASWKWEVNKKNYCSNSFTFYSGRIADGVGKEKLITILRACGQHLTHYTVRDNFSDRTKFQERKELAYNFVPKFCPNVLIAHITINPYQRISIHEMAMHWNKLEELEIKDLSQSVEKNFYELLRNNKQLKILELEYSGYKPPGSDEFFNYLPSTIEKLTIDMSISKIKKFKNFLSASKNWTSLSHLEFEYLRYMSDGLATAIGNIKSLTHLTLQNICRVESSTTIDQLANMVNLKSLDLSRNQHLNKNGKLHENNIINILEGCKQLEELIIDYNLVTVERRDDIAKFERVKVEYYMDFCAELRRVMNRCIIQ